MEIVARAFISILQNIFRGWVRIFNELRDSFKSYHWEKLTFSKLRFSKFKEFVTKSVFGELQLT